MESELEKTRKRFFSKVTRTEADCWEWHRADKFSGGYGKFNVKAKQVLAHRYSWFLHQGTIPKGLLVCHTCDNRVCVNPQHLFLGTHADNTRDAWNKGRVLFGEKSPCSKITEVQVREIRRLCETGLTNRTIAKKYNLNQSQVSRIKTGKRWGSVSDERVS